MINRTNKARQFHSSSRALAKFYNVTIPTSEAAKPIAISPQCNLSVQRLPSSEFPPECPHGRYTYAQLVQHKEALRRFRESSVYYKQMAADTALVRIAGPLGTGYVPIPEWIDLKVSKSNQASNANALSANDDAIIDIWHGQGITGGQSDNEINERKLDMFLPPATDKDSLEDRYLYVSAVDPLHPLQKRHWGFYHRRIASYVKHTQEGFQLPLRLVGVGYRAAVEDMNIGGPEKSADMQMFHNFTAAWLRQANHNRYRRYIGEHFPDSLWGQVHTMKLLQNHSINKHFHTVYEAPAGVDITKIPVPKKLVVKLGYSHNVELPVPPFLQVTCPSPTKIILSGIDEQKVREFAALIRKYRPPEPYKGKGVFVADETIILKSKKAK